MPKPEAPTHDQHRASVNQRRMCFPADGPCAGDAGRMTNQLVGAGQRLRRGSRGMVHGDEALESRLRARDRFFEQSFEIQQLLQPLEQLPGVSYFIKDLQSRLMLVGPQGVKQMGLRREEELIGKNPHDYLPKDQADKFLADDRWVLRHGRSLLTVSEVWNEERKMKDWMITHKYPLRDGAGKMVGIVGVVQSFETRRKLAGPLGPVGKVADYIRENVSGKLLLSEIAKHAGCSERQLQRNFQRVFGMSIRQFIIQSRVHAASQELIHTSRSIAEIASGAGFNDQSAFSNTFRGVVGISPRDYRAKHLRNGEAG